MHGGPGGKWSLPVKTRSGGPTFATWWQHACQAVHGYDHEIDMWPYVEQGRVFYEDRGLTHREFADHVVEVDMRLRKDLLDAHNVQVVRTKIGAPQLPPRLKIPPETLAEVAHDIGPPPDALVDWQDLPRAGAGKSISLAIADIQCAVRLINGTSSDRYAATLRLEAAIEKLW